MAMEKMNLEDLDQVSGGAIADDVLNAIKDNAPAISAVTGMPEDELVGKAGGLLKDLINKPRETMTEIAAFLEPITGEKTIIGSVKVLDDTFGLGIRKK